MSFLAGLGLAVGLALLLYCYPPGGCKWILMGLGLLPLCHQARAPDPAQFGTPWPLRTSVSTLVQWDGVTLQGS